MDAEHLNSHLCSQEVKTEQLLRKQFGSFLQRYHWPCSHSLVFTLEKWKFTFIWKLVHKCFTAALFITNKNWKDPSVHQEKMVTAIHPHNRRPPGSGREQAAETCTNRDETQSDYAKWKEPASKRYRPYDPIYMTSQEDKAIVTKSWLSRVGQGGERLHRSSCREPVWATALLRTLTETHEAAHAAGRAPWRLSGQDAKLSLPRPRSSLCSGNWDPASHTACVYIWMYIYVCVCVYIHTYINEHTHTHIQASLAAQSVKRICLQSKRPVAMQETLVWSLGGEDPLEKAMSTHSSILAWKIPWTEEPGGLKSTGSQESDTT